MHPSCLRAKTTFSVDFSAKTEASAMENGNPAKVKGKPEIWFVLP